MVYPLVNCHITMERSTIFDGKIHYFDWAMFNSYVTNYQRVMGLTPLWTGRIIGLTIKMVDQNGSERAIGSNPVANLFVEPLRMGGSCTTKLKPKWQLVVLVVRWLVGRLANSMVMDSSKGRAPASQKPLSLFGNGWEMG